MTGAAACEVEDLTKRFGQLAALDGVGFAVSPGEIFGLLGPNGGGKTTLFRILATLLRPDGGVARVDGLDVTRAPAEVRRRLGVVFQSPALDKKLTVRENLAYHGALYGIVGARLAARVDLLLERFGLSDRAGSIAESLSGGLLRRLDLARGLLHGPRLVLLDEPSTGLDPAARRELWSQLARLRDEGTTIVVTTHILEEAESCSRIAILDRGKLVALGPPHDLKAEIGADVITIAATDPEGLGARVRERFGAEARLLDGRLRVERGDGHTFIPQLIEAFRGEVREVTLSRPTLEDVFLARTGRTFAAAEAPAGSPGAPAAARAKGAA